MLLITHIATVTTAYALFLLAFVVSLALIKQEAHLKQKRLNSWTFKLPSLKVLDKVNLRFLTIGFVCMACGVASGYVYGIKKGINFLDFNSQLFGASLTLLIYAVLLLAVFFKGYRGSRAAWISVFGFTAALVLFWGVNFLGGSFHAN